MARSTNNSLFNMLADVRMSPESVVPELMRQPLPIQEKFVELFVAYIRSMAVYYQYGYFPNGTQNIAVVCKRLNDIGLDHFGKLPEYAYGDILEDA
jgi:hypothetical protein